MAAISIKTLEAHLKIVNEQIKRETTKRGDLTLEIRNLERLLNQLQGHKTGLEADIEKLRGPA